MVGLDRAAVELLERDGRHPLVGQAESLHHRDRRRRVEVLEQRELHVGQHERAVALRDEQRTGELDVVDGAPVDDARVALHRVDPEARPREIGERQAGDDRELDLTRRRVVQQRHRALGHRRVARHRVTSSPCSAAATSSAAAISVYACSRSGAASYTASNDSKREAFGFEIGDRRMPARAHEPDGCGVDGGARHREHVIGPGRSEAHDDDPARHPRPYPPAAVVLEQPVGAHTPWRGFHDP